MAGSPAVTLSSSSSSSSAEESSSLQGRADCIVSNRQEQAVIMATTTTMRKTLSATATKATSTTTSASSLLINAADDNNELCHDACDACPLCDDVCDNPACSSCREKKLDSSQQQPRTFTQCQIKRHNHAGSAWIVAGRNVYDVTSYLDRHPAGSACILSVAGGQYNVLSSLRKHKKYAQQKWEKFIIGTLIKCNKEKLFGGTLCCA